MQHPLLIKALQAHHAGELDFAAESFNGYLQENPMDPQAWYLLGMVELEQGKFEACIEKIHKAIAINNTSAQYFCSLGLAFDRLGNIQQAEEAYQQAEKMRPDVFQVHFDFGCFLKQHQRHGEAINYFKKSIELNQRHIPSYMNIVSTLLSSGKIQQAEVYIKKANQLQPEQPQLLNNLANILMEHEQYSQALEWLERAQLIEKDNVQIEMTYGQLNYLLENKNKAEETFRKILKLDSENYLALSLLANCLIDKEQYIEAEQLLAKSIRLNPDDLGSHLHLGKLLTLTGENKVALKVYRKALSKHPNSAAIFYAMGVVHTQLGNFDESRIEYIKALEADKFYLKALHAITKTTAYKNTEYEEVKLALDLLEKHTEQKQILTDDKAIDLYFSLGKIFDDVGEYATSFNFYKKGNQLRYQKNPYKIQKFINHSQSCFQQFKQTKSKVKIDKLTKKPIFVVGMPRSGTTLLEQILSSHSQIYGAGELNQIQMAAKQLTQNSVKLSELTESLTAKLLEQYQAKLNTLDIPQAKSMVIDKNPINFMHLGLIKSLMPTATIIHIQRHPLDIILSIYFQRFAKGHQYAFDLDALSEYYKQYQLLMNFWHQQFGEDILNCRYDLLVQNPEQSITKILDKIGLKWEPECIQFHHLERKVDTASSWQVRQPVYTGSINRWRNYEKFLEHCEIALSEEIQLWEQGAA